MRRHSKLTLLLPTILLALVSSRSTLHGAALMVDWLPIEFSNGKSELITDGGQNVGEVEINFGNGIPFPGSLRAGNLASQYWVDSGPLGNVLSEDDSIPTGRLRMVAPQGSLNYGMSFRIEESFELVLMLGQFYGDGADSSLPLSILGDEADSLQIQFLGSFGWSDGISSFTKELSWDGSQLDFSGLGREESGFAFFHIEGQGAATVEIPSGFAVGAGDEIEFAVGLVTIPEPESSLLVFCSLAACCFRRRSARGRDV